MPPSFPSLSGVYNSYQPEEEGISSISGPQATKSRGMTVPAEGAPVGTVVPAGTVALAGALELYVSLFRLRMCRCVTAAVHRAVRRTVNIKTGMNLNLPFMKISFPVN